jgi:hypothetical protein
VQFLFRRRQLRPMQRNGNIIVRLKFMNVVFDILVIVVACFAAYLVYRVAEQTLRHLGLRTPGAIAFAVALLTLLAVVNLGKGVVLLLLIPYAALGISLVVLFLLSFYGVKMQRTAACAIRSAQLCLRWVCHAAAERSRRHRLRPRNTW